MSSQKRANDEIRHRLRLKNTFDNRYKDDNIRPILPNQSLIEKCLIPDEALSISALNDLYLYLYSLDNENEFDKFCETFPYDIFLQFIISLPENSQRNFALLIFSRASGSDYFPISYSQDVSILGFFASLLSSLQSDEIESTLFIISRFITQNPECAAFFVASVSLHKKLQFTKTTQEFARILAILSEYHPESLQPTLELIPLCFQVHDHDTIYFALLALKFAIQNVPDLAEIVLSMIGTYLELIFDFEDLDIANRMDHCFTAVLEILLEVPIAPPQFTKLIFFVILNAESTSLILLSLAVLRHHKTEWRTFFEDLCFILQAKMTDASFELQKSYFATILMYFKWEEEIDYALIQYLAKFLEDVELKKPCMIVLDHIANYYLVDNPKNASKEVLHTLHDFFLSQIVPIVNQIVSNEDDPEILEKAQSFLVILEHEN